MANSSGRRIATPMFFKVILDPNADSLRIPPEFTKRMGHNLPSPVLLKVPSGETMEVELNQCDGEAMLQRGWREFSDRYSLQFGHFLVFYQYNAKSNQFNVSICDMSGVEIEYPAEAPKARDTRKVKLENRENTTQRSRRTRKHIDVTNEGDGNRRRFSKGVKMPRGVAMERMSTVAFQEAMSFASAHIIPKKNPFHISIMSHSSLSKRCSLSVPLSFARKNLPHKDATSVRMVTNGKPWMVRCLIREWGARLSGGWKGFVQDNGLKVDDVCLFEVVTKKSKVDVWNVIVFRS